MRKLLSYWCLMSLISVLACSPEGQADKQREDLGKQTHYRVKIKTNLGEILVRLHNETPKHRDNFIKLAKEGFYDSLLFHAVQPYALAVAGAPDSKTAPPDARLGMLNLGYTIEAEIDTNILHIQGALGAYHFGPEMNPSLASTASQFYFVHGRVLQSQQFAEIEAKNGFAYSQEQKNAYLKWGGLPSMDRKFTLFGQIESGLDVLNTMVNQRLRDFPVGRPLNPIRILSMEVVEPN